MIVNSPIQPIGPKRSHFRGNENGLVPKKSPPRKGGEFRTRWVSLPGKSENSGVSARSTAEDALKLFRIPTTDDKYQKMNIRVLGSVAWYLGWIAKTILDKGPLLHLDRSRISQIHSSRHIGVSSCSKRHTSRMRTINPS